jgi:hypothetical protein
MIELPIDNFNLVSHLLDDTLAGLTYAKAVLNKNHSGRVFVNNSKEPTASFIWAPYQYSFLIGNLNDSGFVNSTINWLNEQNQANGYYCLVIEPNNKATFLRHMNEHVDELSIITKTPSIETERECKKICDENTNLRIVPLSSLTITQEKEAKELIGVGKLCWDTYDDLIAKGRAISLVIEDVVVGICVSAWVSGAEEEVWINIAENYKGNNMATVLAAKFVLDSIKDSATLIWQTTSDNLASIRISEKLLMKQTNSPIVFIKTY